LGVPVIGLVYEHGRFAPRDTAAAAEALAGYALGLAGYAGIKVLAPAFYALDDARTPMLVSVLSMATNYALNWLFVRRLGFGHLGGACGPPRGGGRRARAGSRPARRPAAACRARLARAARAPACRPDARPPRTGAGRGACAPRPPSARARSWWAAARARAHAR